MATQHYRCEDCGKTFIEVIPDREEQPVACPECGGLDLQLLAEEETEGE